jgi:hypothetical protein
LKKRKNKTCIECFHCKVSAKSTENRRLCFCAKEGTETRPQEPFWVEKEVCGAFEGMGSRVTLRPRAFKVPLLKGADFLGGLSRR